MTFGGNRIVPAQFFRDYEGSFAGITQQAFILAASA